jgi:DNA-binding GntR family transcriptional regulator
VSRTPISDALARLAGEGLVEIYPQTGSFVSRLRLETVETAQFVRLALETAAVRRVVARGDAAVVVQLEVLFARQANAVQQQDFEGFHKLDEDMHDVLGRATGLVGFAELAARERSQIDRVRRLLLHYGKRMSATLSEHAEIIEAIRKTDAEAAVRAVTFHIGQMSLLLKELRLNRPELFGD